MFINYFLTECSKHSQKVMVKKLFHYKFKAYEFTSFTKMDLFTHSKTTPIFHNFLLVIFSSLSRRKKKLGSDGGTGEKKCSEQIKDEKINWRKFNCFFLQFLFRNDSSTIFFYNGNTFRQIWRENQKKHNFNFFSFFTSLNETSLYDLAKDFNRK